MGAAPRVHLIIFARTPVAGRVKTRLIGPLTPQQAMELHQAMIADTAALVAALPIEAERAILFSEEAPAMELPAGIHARRQSEGDLGARLAAAFGEALARGAHKAIVLGSDSPHLPPAHILEAERALGAMDLVLGPAEDGGFYLVGARPERFSPCVFAGVEWGSPRVLGQTQAAAYAAGLSTTLLPPFYDLDEWQDLVRFAAEAPPHLKTRALVAALLRTIPPCGVR